MKRSFPLSRPVATGSERKYLDAVLNSSDWSGGGEFTRRCEAFIAKTMGLECSALLMPSGTAALETAALVLELGPGDEVILPSFTFSSCANAIVLRGATPVFVDVQADTLNIDPAKIEEAVTPRTRAIMLVHYGGICCDVDAVAAIAEQHSLHIIEDAAQAFLSSYHGRPAGSLGTVAAFSFHETKNLGCGEGGAFVTQSKKIGKMAEIVREKGTNRSEFFRGEVDKYSWVEIGSSYLASEFQAAVLLAQLERSREITDARLELWNGYYERLEALDRRGIISRPVVPAKSTHNGHVFRVMMRDEQQRDTVMQILRNKGINAAFHFVPLHTSRAGQRWGRACGSMDVTLSASARLLRLPLHFGMNEADIEFISQKTVEAVEAASGY